MRQAHKPTISIIIVAYNGKGIIDACLSSIKKQTRSPLETIVVDNASRDGTSAHIKRKFPFVKLITLKENLGFAGGNNVGIKEARGSHIFFLNQDTELEQTSIAQITDAIAKEKDQMVGMWTLKLMHFHTEKIDTIGVSVGALGIAKEIQREQDIGQLDGPCGAAAVFRKDALQSIATGSDYFDSRLFMYVEDVDLLLRVKQQGWKNKYLPVVVHHLHGASTTEADTKRVKDPFIYLLLRNRVIVFMKNRTYLPLFFIPYLLLQAALLVKYSLQGKGGLAWSAITDGFAKRILPPSQIIKKYS